VQLENKVAAVTGSSLGIGRAIALAFGREGVSVAINYRSHPEEKAKAVQEIEQGGGRAISVQADVSDPEGVRNLIGQPEDVASMAVYLASDASSYSTGSTFFVDGGMMRKSGSL
jgi:3-oxoacyl-[acyl-carrier protein] reductase